MEELQWNADLMLEVQLKEADDFLKVRETLSRIGVASRKERKLYQSCHILHKQGRQFIVHFKELFALDGKPTNISINDLERRNTIAGLLEDWDLVKIIGNSEHRAPLSQIKVLSYREKDDWILETKYNIGKKQVEQIMNLKLLRLRSGEDVICEVTKESADYIFIKNPAMLMPMQGQGQHMQMGMAPWMPFSEQSEFEIPRDWLVVMSDVVKDIANNYNQIFGSGIVVPDVKVDTKTLLNGQNVL